MNWLTPGLAGIAAAIAVPSLLILYFLKLRRRDMEVSTTLLWKKTIQDIQANAPFQKLRRNILLLLQLLALGAALVAIAQPQMTGASPPANRTVIIIDRSASMSATDETIDGRTVTRLEKAKDEAIKVVAAMRDGGVLNPKGGDQAMVVAFAQNAEIVQPYTASKARLEEAIRSIEPTDEPTDFTDVMRVAGPFIKPSTIKIETGTGRDDAQYLPGAPVALFSDGAIGHLDAVEKHPESEFRYTTVGGAADALANVAITALGAERSYDRPERISVFVGLQSTDTDRRTVDVEFGIDGAIGMVKSATLPAATEAEPGRGGVVFALDRTEAAIITVRIPSNDALVSDNTARLIIPPAKRLSVALVTSGNYFLKSAIGAIGVSEVTTITSADFLRLRDAGQLSDHDVYVLDNWLPDLIPAPPTPPTPSASADAPADGDAAESAERGTGQLPPGNYLIIGKTPDITGLTPSSQTLKTTGIVDWDRDHPALRFVSLSSLVIGNAPVVEATRDVTVLATSGAGPAIVDASRGSAHALVVTFDVTRSTWPLDAGFIVFLGQAIRFLGDEGGSTGAAALQPGQILTERLPDGVGEARLRSPDGAEVTLRAGADGRVSFGPIETVGLYTLSWAGQPGPQDPVINGRPTRTIAVNLADAEESRIATETQLTLPTGKVTASNANNTPEKRQRRLWPWILLGAIGVLMLEWFVYNRKVHL